MPVTSLEGDQSSLSHGDESNMFEAQSAGLRPTRGHSTLQMKKRFDKLVKEPLTPKYDKIAKQKSLRFNPLKASIASA